MCKSAPGTVCTMVKVHTGSALYVNSLVQDAHVCMTACIFISHVYVVYRWAFGVCLWEMYTLGEYLHTMNCVSLFSYYTAILYSDVVEAIVVLNRYNRATTQLLRTLTSRTQRSL